jgi:hypothetical protein
MVMEGKVKGKGKKGKRKGKEKKRKEKGLAAPKGDSQVIRSSNRRTIHVPGFILICLLTKYLKIEPRNYR